MINGCEFTYCWIQRYFPSHILCVYHVYVTYFMCLCYYFMCLRHKLYIFVHIMSYILRIIQVTENKYFTCLTHYCNYSHQGYSRVDWETPDFSPCPRSRLGLCSVPLVSDFHASPTRFCVNKRRKTSHSVLENCFRRKMSHFVLENCFLLAIGLLALLKRKF